MTSTRRFARGMTGAGRLGTIGMILGAVVLVVVVAGIWTKPAALASSPAAPTIGDDLDAWLASQELSAAAEHAIIPGAEKRVRWYADRQGSRTATVVVYLHGFSATRQEVAPLGAQLADALQANLFETRLAGHGLETGALAGVSAEDWLDDAAEALAIGRMLGDRLIVVGTSTGATLALAASDLEDFASVASLVLISPNFSPKGDSADFLLRPFGPPIARAMVGETRTWTAANDQQERYWSTTYPLDAVIEMMRLVDRVRSGLPMTLESDVLVLYSDSDQVIDVPAIKRSMAEIEAPRVELLEVGESGDPSNHVLAGDILSPETTTPTVERILGFLGNAAL